MAEPETVAARPRVLIAGGGIAGLEAVLALHELAPDRVHVTVVAPDAEFLYKPLTVAEPFTHEPAETHELEPALAELDADLVRASLEAVTPEAHAVSIGGGKTLGYDYLMVCVGGRARPAYRSVETFWSDRVDLPADDLIHRAHASFGRTLTLVVPPATTWSLPLYEMALLLRRRSEELGLADLRLRFVTPEPAPLAVFGTRASAAIARLFEGRRISIETGCSVVQDDADELRLSPQGTPLDSPVVLSLPIIDGPRIPGLPCDPHGFLPIDEHARVEGCRDVYAAGDGANFPVKQGGLATQQADAAAEHIAAGLGVDLEPQPFRPVLRGQLLTGMESLNLKHGLTGGQGEGTTSLDYLWWPPGKVAGRFLSAWLTKTRPGDLEPPVRPMDVEASLPHEWHDTPMSYDAEIPESGPAQ
jgi:sulfide:quinone oxidoreductase